MATIVVVKSNGFVPYMLHSPPPQPQPRHHLLSSLSSPTAPPRCNYHSIVTITNTGTIRMNRTMSTTIRSNTAHRRNIKDIWLQSVYDNDDEYKIPDLNHVDIHNNNSDSNNSLEKSTPPPSSSSSSSSTWREWYIPQEYENPWDMIHTTNPILSKSRFRALTKPLPSHTSSSSYNQYASSFYNTNTNNKNTAVVVLSLDAIAKHLDYMTKHCMTLLQNYHNFTMTAQNSITTEYANVIFHSLLQLLPTNTTTSHISNANNNNKTTATTSNQSSTNTTTSISHTEKSTIIAYRAYLILQNMEFTDGTILMIPPGTNQILTPHTCISDSSHNHLYTDSNNNNICIRRRRRRPWQNPTLTLQEQDDDSNNSTTTGSSTSNMMSTDNTSIRSHRLPRTIPKPNRDTYNTILLLLSRTSGSYTIPQMAQAIVEQMEYRYNVLQELDVKVTNYHCNCVLLAWSLCLEYDKCLYATQLLIYNATRPNSHEIVDVSSYIHVLRICANHVKLQPPTTAATAAMTNTNSSSNNSNSKKTQPQTLQLFGANVAIQLWKEMFERNATMANSHNSNDDAHHQNMNINSSTENQPYDPNIPSSSSQLDSHHHDTNIAKLLTQYLSTEERQRPMYVPDVSPHFYSHFLQAIRPLPALYPSHYNYNNPNVDHQQSNTKKYSTRDMYFMKCMDHAIEHGKVNSYVLQEFFVHVKNMTIFDMYLGEYRSHIFGMNPNDAVQCLMTSCIPKSWYRNVQTSTHNNSTSTGN